MTTNNLRNEILLITDAKGHVSRLVSQAAKDLPLKIICVPSSLRFDRNWSRFSLAKHIIIDWSCHQRNPAGVIEEIQAASKNRLITEKVICILTAPVRSDIYCLAELGIRQVVRFSNSAPLLTRLQGELRRLLTSSPKTSNKEKLWKHVYSQAMAVATGKIAEIDQVEATLNKLLGSDPRTARYHDCMALILQGRHDFEAAHKHWESAVELNPNYFLAYENWAKSLTALNKHDAALVVLKRMCALNNNRISRLAQMGFLQLEMKNLVSAEHLFRTALQKNPNQPKALNGLAEIQFLKGEYDECKRLLAQSSQAPAIASRLNKLGVQLVQKGNYELALELYRNARNVLPDNEKGPLLFYNMALCYSKWGQPAMARKFATLALIKDPAYQKPRNLLATLPTDDAPLYQSLSGQPTLVSSAV
jgi:Tfp pilus assembly protein PilF